MDLTESLTLVAHMAAPAFSLLVWLAAFGAVLVAVTNQVMARANSTVFYDKYAQQTATMGLVLLGVCTCSATLAIVLATSRMPWLKQWLMGTNSPAIPFYLVTAIGIIFYFPYVLLWKKLRSQKGVHISVGAISGMFLLCSLVSSVAVLSMFILNTSMDATVFQVATIPLDKNSFFWPLALLCFTFALGAASGLSLPYMILRQNKDSFGRDYYRFSIPVAARWGGTAMIFSLASHVWLFMQLPPNTQTLITKTGSATIWLGTVGCTILCSVLWGILAKTKNPMRMKWVAFTCSLLLWVTLSLTCAASLSIVSSF